MPGRPEINDCLLYPIIAQEKKKKGHPCEKKKCSSVFSLRVDLLKSELNVYGHLIAC